MYLITPARGLAAVLLLGSGAMWAQMQAPATNASSLPATSPTAAPVAVNTAPAEPPARPAKVEFADAKLTVTADNSSLIQILREISRQTGMKITGGVADERVFGSYGPAPAGRVLGDLLEGTGSNMELQETPAKIPIMLTLTPQHGGATPANPNAPGVSEDTGPRETEAVTSNSPPEEVAPQRPIEPRGGFGTGAMPPAPGFTQTPGSTPESPNGVASPQQIFEQLQRMQPQSQQH